MPVPIIKGMLKNWDMPLGQSSCGDRNICERPPGNKRLFDSGQF